MRRKGQLLSQPFIYIFALVVGALILIWGGKVIYDMLSTAGQVEAGRFVKELEADVKEYYNYGEGSEKKLSLQQWLPKEIKYVCILDNEKYTDKFSQDCKLKKQDGTITNCNAIKTLEPTFEATAKLEAKNKGKNVFFLPSKAVKLGKFKIENLKPASPLLCFARDAKMVVTSKVTFVEAS